MQTNPASRAPLSQHHRHSSFFRADRTWWTKLAALAVVTLTAVAYVYPTVANLNTDESSYPIRKKITLGLDLQGGLYMVFGADIDKVFHDVLARQLEGLKASAATKSLVVSIDAEPAGATEQTRGDPRLSVSFDPASHDRVRKLVKEIHTDLRIVDDQPGRLQLALERDFRAEAKRNVLNQSIQVVRNRIDEFGVAEPAISTQGEDRIVVELPGIREVERAKQLVGRTAKLEFKLVNDRAMPQAAVEKLVAQLEKDNGLRYKEGTRFSDYVRRINELARGRIPAGSEIAFGHAAESPAGAQLQAQAQAPLQTGPRVPYLLFSATDVTGEELQDARVGIDQESQSPIVGFEMTPAGAALFEKLTGEHRGERLAIVLDNVVHSAPVIQSKIGGRGQITLGRGNSPDVMKEAKDLAIVLRAGALPAQLDLLEQRVIGPTLGQDSIRRGLTAGLVGCALVFAFMIFYYRMSGVIAVISLLMNGLLALAILIGLDATLTLPGIAGLALTIGMAVDSNVIIFERIRDELEEGKPPVAAIRSGFKKAFTSIFDANITHAIVAVVLLNFGTGPIRGFAVTLLVGIVTTLFTAVTVCKLFFDGYIAWKRGEIRELSI